MTDVVHASVRSREIRTEEGTVVHSLTLVDDKGHPLSNTEVVRRFKDLTITGIYVKPTLESRPSQFEELGLPGFALITDLEEDYVILDGQYRVPRSEFHSLYRLD